MDVWAGSPIIRDNDVSGAQTSGLSGSIEDNAVTGGDVGIIVTSGAPAVDGNTIEGVTGRGLVVTLGASPALSGNTSCGNGTDLWVAEGATLRSTTPIR